MNRFTMLSLSAIVFPVTQTLIQRRQKKQGSPSEGGQHKWAPLGSPLVCNQVEQLG